MQMLKKMFKSDDKYYLELDSVQEKAIDAATKANNATQAKVKAVAKSEPVKETSKKVSEAANQVSTKITDAVPEQLQPETTPTTKAAKTKKKSTNKSSKAGANGKKAPIAKNSGVSSYDPPFWVAAMSSNNGSTGNESSTGSAEQTFATDNLMPTITKFRRSPGPSLNQFREMAKNARIRRR